MINMAELASFEQRYLCLEAKTADEIRDWISSQHASIRVNTLEDIKKDAKDGMVARMSRACMDDVALVSYRYNIALEGEFVADYDAYFVCLPLSGFSKRLCPQHGEIVQQKSQLLIYRRMEGLRNINSSDYANISLVVPAHLLEKRLQSLIGGAIKSPLRFEPLVDVDSGAGRAVVSLINYLMSQFVSMPDPFGNVISSTSMKSYLSTVLLSSLSHNYSTALHARASIAVPGTVKRAEEYMRELCAEAITIDDLAIAAGCSARSLHAAFKKFRGATPMSVLCDLRLEAAHEEIIRDVGTVTEIATKYGFSNMGRFARQYAQKYGQNPSQTRLTGQLSIV